MSVPRLRLGTLDWTRPFGIPFDRSTLPPDDEIQDVAAWLAGRFDTLAAQQFCLGEFVGDGAGSPGSGSGNKCNTVADHLRASVRPSPTLVCSCGGVAEVVDPDRAAATRPTTTEQP